MTAKTKIGTEKENLVDARDSLDKVRNKLSFVAFAFASRDISALDEEAVRGAYSILNEAINEVDKIIKTMRSER